VQWWIEHHIVMNEASVGNGGEWADEPDRQRPLEKPIFPYSHDREAARSETHPFLTMATRA
jgi:hypothetical protein